jgi:polysaccharide export outer membrane protein
MTQAANIHRVEIRRRQGNVSGQVVNVDLWQLFQSGDLSQDITLRDGDQIFLPTVADINPVETRQLATASFAAKPTEPLQISVVGEVYRPGPYIIEPIQRSINGTISPPSPPTVTRAIQIAGGITSLADVRQIQIHRTTRVGNEKSINIDMWKLLQAGDINQDVILQEGDTIVVPKSTNINPAEATELAMASFSPDKIKVSVVGEVGKPGAVDLQPNTTLNQALLTAGGFNSRARQTVDLIRLNPNGTVSKQPIAVDFSLGIDENTNPALRNNDIIVVTPSDTAGIVDVLSLIFSPIGNLLRLFGR